MKKAIILGQNGNLAQSLLSQYPEATTVPKEEFLMWMRNPLRMREFFSEIEAMTDEVDLFNSAEITNANADIGEITLANFHLPVFLSEQSTALDYRLITFGTVMEQIPKYAMSNPYLESKLRFYNEYQSNIDWANSNLHVQMHTLYGGKHIHPHMFLGQIYSALIHKKSFKMSGGIQIREYHHVDDVAKGIRLLVGTQQNGVNNISHGFPEKLKDIAESIFIHFDAINLLNLSSGTMDEHDNRELVFKKSKEIPEKYFRPTIVNIIQWLEELGVKHVKVE